MDKRRSCANCGSVDHHVADCISYKQGLKSLRYAPDETGIHQMEELEFYSSLLIKIGARSFLCSQEGHLRIICPLFWEAVRNQNHPKLKLPLAAVQNSRNRRPEKDLEKRKIAKQGLATKEIEQRLRQETQKQQRDETLSAARVETDISDTVKIRSNCNTLKMETGKPFGITKSGARIMSIITVDGQKKNEEPEGTK